jgi:hypothetical protein
LAKENKILRVNQCSNTYQRNGSYAGDKELSFHADGHEIEALAESLQAGIQFIFHKKNTKFLVLSCVLVYSFDASEWSMGQI